MAKNLASTAILLTLLLAGCSAIVIEGYLNNSSSEWTRVDNEKIKGNYYCNDYSYNKNADYYYYDSLITFELKPGAVDSKVIFTGPILIPIVPIQFNFDYFTHSTVDYEAFNIGFGIIYKKDSILHSNNIAFYINKEYAIPEKIIYKPNEKKNLVDENNSLIRIDSVYGIKYQFVIDKSTIDTIEIKFNDIIINKKKI